MKRLIVVALIVLLLLTSCGTTESFEQPISYSSYEEFVLQNPNKTVLVWQQELQPEYIFGASEINDYLDLLGKNYVVYFEGVNPMKHNEYFDILNSKIDSGEPIDILSTCGYSAEQNHYSTAYHYFVYENMYEPLKEYLENTAIGQKLYSQMPQGYWDSLTVNGEIYGVSTAGMIGTARGYYVNEKLAKKYGWDINKSIYEQIEILKSLKEDNYVAVSFSDTLGMAMYYPNSIDNLYGVYYDKNTDSIRRVTEDEEYLELLKLINILQNEQLIEDSAPGKDVFMYFSAGVYGSEAWRYGETVKISGTNMISCFEKLCYASPNMATGISSSSENKDLAFDLLATVQTDPYLNNLLAYGTNESNEDGRIHSSYSFTYDTYANKMISYPTDQEPIDYAEQFVDFLTSENMPEYWGFGFDVRPVWNLYGEIIKTMRRFDFNEAIPFEELIEELNTELDEAGITEFLEEVNRQYKKVDEQND